jgi:hypothetical protein
VGYTGVQPRPPGRRALQARAPSAESAVMSAHDTDPEAESSAEEEAFFRRGDDEDRAARAQLRQRLAALPRWPGLRWAIALVAGSFVAATIILVTG